MQASEATPASKQVLIFALQSSMHATDSVQNGGALQSSIHAREMVQYGCALQTSIHAREWLQNGCAMQSNTCNRMGVVWLQVVKCSGDAWKGSRLSKKEGAIRSRHHLVACRRQSSDGLINAIGGAADLDV
jgi:hypothetical protein